MKLVEKIKSATTLLDLALRAFVFVASWFFLPFWFFLLVGLYLYFVPLFRPFELALPFLILVFFAYILPPGFFTALLFAVLFYLILGIKDLVFIDRKSAYEILMLLLLFIMFVRFFSDFDNGSSTFAFFYSLLISTILFFLAKSYERYGNLAENNRAELKKLRHISLTVVAILVWQLSFAILFLPLNFLYQSAILFFFAAVFLELIFDYLGGGLTRHRTLTYFSIFLVFFVVIIGSARWGL